MGRPRAGRDDERIQEARKEQRQLQGMVDLLRVEATMRVMINARGSKKVGGVFLFRPAEVGRVVSNLKHFRQFTKRFEIVQTRKQATINELEVWNEEFNWTKIMAEWPKLKEGENLAFLFIQFFTVEQATQYLLALERC